MKCPNCGNREFAVYEALGFTSKESPLKECSVCGLVWRIVPSKGEGAERVDVIKESSQKLAA